jgi:hypothetical protein
MTLSLAKKAMGIMDRSPITKSLKEDKQMDEMEKEVIETTLDNGGVVTTILEPSNGMNGWIVAGVAAGSTLIGGLLVWGVPKLIGKIKAKHAEKKLAKSVDEHAAKATDDVIDDHLEDDNK